MKFNPGQKAVIRHDICDLLVTASAGSGKTSTLVERVFKKIEEGYSISRMIVVTYTKTAAAELMERLEQRITQELSTATDAVLRGKLMAALDDLPFASIGTLHSFAKRLITSHFQLLDIEPDSRVASDADVRLLKEKAYLSVLENYLNAKDADFDKLYRMLCQGRRDTALHDTVTKTVYEFLVAIPDIDFFVNNIATSNYNEGLFNSKLANEVAELIKNEAKMLKAPLMAPHFSVYNSIKTPLYGELLGIADNIINASGLSQMTGAIKVEKSARGNPYSAYPAEREELMGIRKKFVTFLSKISKLLNDFDDNIERLIEGKKDVEKLLEVTIAFINRYSELKRANGLLDFPDLEQYSAKLLRDDELCESIRDSYDCIFVDEFQDINPLQYYILKRISRFNRTAVGDGKQGIYRFRQADARIITQLDEEYALEDSKGVREVLNNNYRSAKAILDFVNSVFSRTMKKVGGNPDYASTSMLIAGEDYKTDDKFPPVSLTLIEKNTGKTQAPNVLQGVYSVVNDNDTIIDVSESIVLQGQFIFERIQDLVTNGVIYDTPTSEPRRIKYSDITLLYSARSRAVHGIVDYLIARGISVDIYDLSNDKPTAEVEKLVAYFRALNNPADDGALIPVLLSEYGGFSYDELATIKMDQPACYDGFYVCAAREAKKNSEMGRKLKKFYERLQSDRVFAASQGLYAIAEHYVSITNLRAIAKGSEDGETALNTLNNFIDSLADDAFGTIADFLACYDDDTKNKFSAKGTGSADSVKTTTVHASKGLEYNIVFLINIDNEPKESTKKKAYLDAEFGAALVHRDVEEKEKEENILISLMKQHEKLMTSSELQRTLYVALTRAKRHLYIVGEAQVTPFGTTFIDMPKRYYDVLNNAAYLNDGKLECPFEALQLERDTAEVADCMDAVDTTIEARVNELRTLPYFHEEATTLKCKYSVTELKNLAYVHRISDNSEDISDTEPLPREMSYHISPEVGTSYHRAMELLDFSTSSADEVAASLDKFVETGAMSAEQREIVQADIVYKILNLDIIKYAANCKTLREQQFYLSASAKSLGVANVADDVLVQGVIDLVILGDKTYLVDYKCSNSPKSELISTYLPQIDLYARAIEEILDVKVDDRYLLVLNRAELIKL